MYYVLFPSFTLLTFVHTSQPVQSVRNDVREVWASNIDLRRFWYSLDQFIVSEDISHVMDRLSDKIFHAVTKLEMEVHEFSESLESAKRKARELDTHETPGTKRTQISSSKQQLFSVAWILTAIQHLSPSF